MPTMLVYDSDKSEISLIRNLLNDICKIDEDLAFCSAMTLQELIMRTNELDEISVSCTDFEAGGETAIKIVKDRDPATMSVIIADNTTSPLLYVRPGIMAAGLMLRPLSKGQVVPMLREIVDAVWIRERTRLFNNEFFTFSTRDGTIRIPYSQILFFEARNKKIVVCTGRTETEFYATLESLSAVIPDYFLRCHKGFIVNKLLVVRVDLSRNLLQLVNEFQVPVSRSYRVAVKEALA